MKLSDELVTDLFKSYKGDIDIDAYVSKLVLLNTPISYTDFTIYPKTYMFYNNGRFSRIGFLISKTLSNEKDAYFLLVRDEREFDKFNLAPNLEFQDSPLNKNSAYLLMYCDGFIDFILSQLKSLWYHYLGTFSVLSEKEYIPNKYINDFNVNNAYFRLETTSNMMVKITKECKYGTVIKEVSLNSKYLVRNWWFSEQIRGRDFQFYDTSLFDDLMKD